MEPQKKYDYRIGIDTGVKTGYACYSMETRQLITIRTFKIDVAMELVADLAKLSAIFVRVEDARLATWKRKQQGHRLKGAGSVMRDAKMWDDFLTRQGIDHEMVRPRKAFTKWTPAAFKKLTGYTGRTSFHGRDAAMLVYGY
jgi:hypothetical protein